MSSTSLISSSAGCGFSISNFMYPLFMIAIGIFLCLLVSTLSTHCTTVKELPQVESTLKTQLIVSTVLLLGGILLAAWLTYPSNFEQRVTGHTYGGLTPWIPYICSIVGLISGMVIAAFTEFVTSHSYFPVRELAESCKSGAGANVTLGLALGYMSTLIPVIFIAITAFVSNKLMGYYGVALAALGMLANLPLSLAIDGYGPISDNAGGIAEMSELGPEVREITDGLDAAGNTTAAIGKGFAIGSACLVALSLYGGFLHNAGLENSSAISLTSPDIS
jgi:inorganic pyrophosphatase